MLIRTHLAITVFGVLLVLPLVSPLENKIIFIVTALIATFIPDIDSKKSSIGRKKVFRPLQFFFKHRGSFHSFSFPVLVSILLVLFLPRFALGFFMGYGLHLFSDCFTKRGIKPFYPYDKICCGNIKSGSKRESFVFYSFLFIDFFILLLLVFYFFGFFMF